MVILLGKIPLFFEFGEKGFNCRLFPFPEVPPSFKGIELSLFVSPLLLKTDEWRRLSISFWRRRGLFSNSELDVGLCKFVVD